MKKSTMQLTVDRILRALHPFNIDRRRKILTIVDNYLDADLEEADDDEETYDDERDGMDESPEERKKREAIENREEREVG